MTFSYRGRVSEETSDIQLFGAGKFEGVALSGGRHAFLPQKVYFVDFYMGAEVFGLFVFYDLSRRLLLSYTFFEGVI